MAERQKPLQVFRLVGKQSRARAARYESVHGRDSRVVFTFALG
jgi:hypothetical protein